ncbi:MAG: archaeal heat shock protein Hsp20 [Dehalococcoidales bacterium]|jgi:HSP20 family protein
MPKKEKNGKVDVDFGMGQISLGGLFKGLGNFMDLASKLSEEGYEKKGEISGLPKGAKGVYGFSIRTLAGKPVIESFGNIKETARGPVVEEVREPMVDIFNEKDRILVIAELPGIAESEIKIEVNGDILNLSAAGRDRKYAREVLLPARVKPDSLKSSYKNGILEITLEKEK